MTTAVKNKKTPKARSAASQHGTRDPANAASAYVDPVWKTTVDAAVNELQRLFAGVDYSVDDYLREKRAGVDAENAVAEEIQRELKRTGREWSVDDYLREKRAGVDAENTMAEENRKRRENAR